MPRGIRAKSESGIYHVMLRGENRQQIFYDAEDYVYFEEILRRVKEASGMRLHAYCLMGNHIHLLIEERQEALSTVFRRLGASFVYWYNIKYERVGHLFQDRYKSEPVESNEYYLTVLRYILHNPVKAGICAQPEDYRYSSAGEYLSGREGITDIAFARSLAEDSELRAFLKKSNEDCCMDVSETVSHRISDAEALRYIQVEFGKAIPEPGKGAERESFNRSIQRLLAAGISIRQLSRLTGLSKKVIERNK